ncbi:4'-phosphopantetheinyl transferase superfamily protein [Streptomyces sp. NPDC002033]|uniref:4'-phosphopantetheinyl transferase family protein n=1 Tax=unclassified Streptomyces TaxID=2593676 RepID=UPI0033271DBC
MIEEILPAGVVSAEAFDDRVLEQLGPGAGLFPEEAKVVALATPLRQQQFATVRVCARRALSRLGVPAVPVVPNRRGAPQWPDGILGSMTHCDGYRAAAVARSTDTFAIGIDAEPHRPLPAGVLPSISLPRERQWIRELGAREPGVVWERLLFSAKESVFKAWYPLTGLELEFEEAEITMDPEKGAFSARLVPAGPVVGGRKLRGFSGRWLVRNGLIVTAVTLPKI